MTRGAIAVIAKAPEPGRSKTRLCPPCTPEQAALLAQAALRDTLSALRRASCERRYVVLDGEPGAWLESAGPDVVVIAQRGHGLGERLAAAFDDIAHPAFIVGMDTPQIGPALLEDGLRALSPAGASLGLAPDGGYWGIGLRSPDARVFAGVPMSSARTGDVQQRRLRSLGLDVALLPPLRDVDTIEDARVVAAGAPATRFATALARLDLAEELAA